MAIKYISISILLFLLMSSPLHAEEANPDIITTEIELFEFIADWESDDGQWVEPSVFEQTKVKDVEAGDLPMTTTQEGHYGF